MIDLLVIGGGINGAGIARDAAGRGLSVVLAERSDLAAATSSASSKLIHGGLRYLEHYEFRLVAEALAEREVLLRVAGHLTRPLVFVMPHVPELRPRWMIRAGLFLYDHLARRSLLPGSRAVRLDVPPYASGLAPALKHGFAYSDCWVDDARLVVANARDAAQRGARILVGVECLSARREGGGWRVRLSSGEHLRVRALVNAAGPWVKQVLNERLGQPSADAVRLVRGSHIVFPRLYDGEHAFILQNDDRRVVFLIPYEEQFTLVGTTDVPIEEGEEARASEAEIDYLCKAASRYLARPLERKQVAWQYAGVRPLYDDGSADPSEVTRDYTLRLDDEAGAPVLSVFGGKITTYRRLAEQALEKLAPHFSGLRGPWTARSPLPGSDFESVEAARRPFFARHRHIEEECLRGIFRRHGSLADEVVGDGRLGENYGGGLTEREVRYLVDHEWARCAEDVLWRRTKCGLHMSEAQRGRVAHVLGR
ncbi:MAG TPA: glycerol-3-phosphate dehydrogenase [Burkholderiales bacterium]|nr:glycerol-3-phosphate dehydrogenase [Burkholderiales bacterium]